jgi:Cap4-like dsDNA endonuclease family protein
MPKKLLDELLEKPQRETAGSDASSRFDYQRSWAFCEMLRRHMQNADYLVAFEFHDDTVFLSPSDVPTNVDFYQVKTSKSPNARKLSDFTARPKQASSILGKMFQNFEGIWSAHAVRVILVSNVAFEFANEGISAKDITPRFRDKIKERLTLEIPAFSEARINDLHFLVTGVSIDSMQSFLHGEAMELFKAKFGEDHGLNVHSWVRLLQSEIARKNNYASDQVKTVEELVSRKCLAKKAVDDSLALVSAQRKTLPSMALVLDDLKSAGWASHDLMKLNKRMSQAAADYSDATNLEVTKIVQQIEALYHQSYGIGLAALVAHAEELLLTKVPIPYNDRAYLAAITVMVHHEEI